MKKHYPEPFSNFWNQFNIKLEAHVKEITNLKKCRYCNSIIEDYSQKYCETCGSVLEKKQNPDLIKKFIEDYFKAMNSRQNKRVVELQLEIEKLQAIIKGLGEKYKTFKKFSKDRNIKRDREHPGRGFRLPGNWAQEYQKKRGGGWDGILYSKS